MSIDLPGLDRCPKCGAAVKPGDPWCTLCYADLRPPAASQPAEALEPPAAAGPTVAATVVQGPDPLTGPLEAGEPSGASNEAVDGPSWPCSVCGAPSPLASEVCTGCGAPFLAGVRGQEGPLLELPVVGDITRLGRGQRLALAGGVVLVVILLTLILGLLLG